LWAYRSGQDYWAVVLAAEFCIECIDGVKSHAFGRKLMRCG
jgi:hypothetical protein